MLDEVRIWSVLENDLLLGNGAVHALLHNFHLPWLSADNGQNMGDTRRI